MIAAELAAKFWLVADSIRYRRSDTALVRITVPVGESVREGGCHRRRIRAVGFPGACIHELPL